MRSYQGVFFALFTATEAAAPFSGPVTISVMFFASNCNKNSIQLSLSPFLGTSFFAVLLNGETRATKDFNRH